MATKTTKNLKCIFVNERGDNFNVNIADYNPEKTDTEIQTGVEAMLSSGALASGGYAAVSALGAQKVDTTTVDVVFD